MTNQEKYNQVFVEVFNLDASLLNDNFSKDTADNWDSVHQLGIVTMLEELFDIFLDTEDIMEVISYKKGKEVLKKYNIEL